MRASETAVAVSSRTMHKSAVWPSASALRPRSTRPVLIQARGIEMQSLARMIYTSPMPARGAGCRTSLLYVSIVRLRKYPTAPSRVTLDTYVYQHDRRHRSACGSNPNDRVRGHHRIGVHASNRAVLGLFAGESVEVGLTVTSTDEAKRCMLYNVHTRLVCSIGWNGEIASGCRSLKIGIYSRVS